MVETGTASKLVDRNARGLVWRQSGAAAGMMILKDTMMIPSGRDGNRAGRWEDVNGFCLGVEIRQGAVRERTTRSKAAPSILMHHLNYPLDAPPLPQVNNTDLLRHRQSRYDYDSEESHSVCSQLSRYPGSCYRPSIKDAFLDILKHGSLLSPSRV